MFTLKPKHLSVFLVDYESIDKLDIEMLIECLHQGAYKLSTYRLNILRANSYNKSSYDFLPKAFKYQTSEYSFNNLIFTFSDFYDYATDPITIKIDYCEEILKNYPGAKRTLKLYKKLKILHPEYFV